MHYLKKQFHSGFDEKREVLENHEGHNGISTHQLLKTFCLDHRPGLELKSIILFLMKDKLIN